MREWYPASRVSGPLAAHAEAFADRLRAQGFSPGAVSYRLWQFDRLSGWLEWEALAASGLPGASIEWLQRLVALQRSGFCFRPSDHLLSLGSRLAPSRARC